MIFQLAVISYALVTCLQAVLSRMQRKTGRGFVAVVLATHLPLVVVALRPGITNTVANAVGIGRGADFVVALRGAPCVAMSPVDLSMEYPARV